LGLALFTEAYYSQWFEKKKQVVEDSPSAYVPGE
jgi:hypothetical protein